MKKNKKIFLVLSIVILIIISILTILFLKNHQHTNKSLNKNLETNLEDFKTQYEISLLPEKGTFIKVNDKIYNFSTLSVSTKEIIKLTDEQIKNVPVIRSSDNASIVSKSNTQNSAYGYETSIYPIISLGKAIGITNDNKDSNKVQTVNSDNLKDKGVSKGYLFSVKSNNAVYNELLEDIFCTDNNDVSITFVKDNNKLDLVCNANINYLRKFPRIDLDTNIIENTNVVESKLPNNLPSGLYETKAGLFYYLQEDEKNAEELLGIFEQYKQQELEILELINIVEEKTNDRFGYLNLLIPSNTEIYELKDLKLTNKKTTTKQEVEANFSYGNIYLPTVDYDIFYSNGKIYYSLRIGGGNIFDDKTRWTDNVCVSFETLKQVIKTGLDSNFENNTHLTQKQEDVYNFNS